MSKKIKQLNSRWEPEKAEFLRLLIGETGYKIQDGMAALVEAGLGGHDAVALAMADKIRAVFKTLRKKGQCPFNSRTLDFPLLEGTADVHTAQAVGDDIIVEGRPTLWHRVVRDPGNGPVAQLIERVSGRHEVAGLIPVRSTNFNGLVPLATVHVLPGLLAPSTKPESGHAGKNRVPLKRAA